GYVINESAGGVVKDQFGDWLVGFNHNLGVCLVFNVELWSIWNGLFLLQEKGYVKALIQTDCLEALNAIQDGYLGISNSILVRQIKLMLQYKEHWIVRHVPREKNQVVDHLAKMSSVWIDELTWTSPGAHRPNPRSKENLHTLLANHGIRREWICITTLS
ncbi:hypothetical protein Golax_025451, partial [Gossypium laxum]|nr:hypothetical protein [Gossypium laxum]